MILELAAIGYLLGEYAYHRWFESHLVVPNPGHTINVPTAQEGVVVPLIYGRVLVRNPVVAWAGNAEVTTGISWSTGNPYNYGLDLHFIVGIFPEDGSASMNDIFTPMWIGGKPFVLAPGDGTPSSPKTLSSTDSAGFIGGLMEIMPGDNAQDLPGLPWTVVARMGTALIPSSQIPSYRRMLSVFLYNAGGGSGGTGHAWQIGSSPQPGSYGFECDALPAIVVGPGGARFGHGLIGVDLNPIDVILDLLTGKFRKGGLPLSALDMASFDAAAVTLDNEGHGFSRSWEDTADVKDRINEVLIQIDGVMRKDHRTGLISIKLVRPDFDPDSAPLIDPTNCEELQNLAVGGWNGMPADVFVKFTNRERDYGPGEGHAPNDVNALINDNERVQVTLDMPGITTQALADAVAYREMQARSVPLLKCSAIVDRSFLRVLPGDVVKLTWPDANISGVLMRVAGVNRGTLENDSIKLDLIQDYFYVNRGVIDLTESATAHDIVHFPG